jgi:hypothetical protein
MGTRFQIVDEGNDVQGHAEGPAVEVERIKLVTGDGNEITLEPEEDGDRFKIISGPDDVEGHMLKVMPFLVAPKRAPRR